MPPRTWTHPADDSAVYLELFEAQRLEDPRAVAGGPCGRTHATPHTPRQTTVPHPMYNANQHGRWADCARCGLRTGYYPKRGHTSKFRAQTNKEIVAEALRKIHTELGNTWQGCTKKTVDAMISKIEAERKLEAEATRRAAPQPQPRQRNQQPRAKAQPQNRPMPWPRPPTFGTQWAEQNEWDASTEATTEVPDDTISEVSEAPSMTEVGSVASHPSRASSVQGRRRRTAVRRQPSPVLTAPTPSEDSMSTFESATFPDNVEEEEDEELNATVLREQVRELQRERKELHRKLQANTEDEVHDPTARASTD